MGRKKCRQREEAFLYFASLGDERKLQTVAEKFGVSKQLVGKWAMEGKWSARVEKLEREAAEESIEALKKKMSSNIVMQQMAINDTVLKYKDLIKSGNINMNSPTDLLRIIQAQQVWIDNIRKLGLFQEIESKDELEVSKEDNKVVFTLDIK